MAPRIGVRVSTIAVAAVLTVSAGFAQGRGGTTGGGGTTGTTGTGSTGTTGNPGTGTGTGRGVPTTPSTNPTPTQPQMQQPMFISGRVVMEDGTAPTTSVPIERVCGGQQRTEGYTDSKGYFSLELGKRNNGVLIDASEDASAFSSGSLIGTSSMGSSNSSLGSMGMGDTRFINCELRARLAGYRSQVVSLATRRALDNPDVGVILLHRIGASEGGTVSAISLAAPKEARKAYEKGIESLKKKKPEDAIKSFQKAAELYPKYAVALCELGKLQMMRGETEPARESLQTAIQADPKFVVPYVELSFLELQAQRWKEVAAATESAIKLDPFSFPQAFFLNAVANYNLKNMEAAEKSAREAERLDTRHQYPKNTHLLGIILAQKQDFTGAAERFKTYLKVAPGATDAATVKNQLEQVEKISSSAEKQDQ